MDGLIEYWWSFLFFFFLLQLGVSVGDLDIELGSPLDDDLPVLGRDIMSNFSSVSPVVHQEYFQILQVVHDELLEPIRVDELGFVVTSESYFCHLLLSSISPSHPVVNTSWSSPGLFQFPIIMELVSHKMSQLLLHYLLLYYWSHHYTIDIIFIILK